MNYWNFNIHKYSTSTLYSVLFLFQFSKEDNFLYPNIYQKHFYQKVFHSL